MKHRIFACVLALCLLICLCPTGRAAEKGSCGEGITWTYDNGTLTVSGSGAMDDMTGDAPWAAYKDSITAVVFTGGVTYVGAGAFKDYDSLRSVSFGSAMYELGTESFYSCDGLTSLSMPASFKVFGISCLQNCTGLSRIDCAGRFPKFRDNCLWQTTVTIYYPASNPWSVDTINQLESAFGGRITFLASDGSDPNAESQTVPPTEAATTAPTESTTVPTEATTAPTEPSVQTIPPVTTALQTQPAVSTEPDIPSQDNTTLWLILLLVISIGSSAAAVIIHAQQVKRRRKARRRRKMQ